MNGHSLLLRTDSHLFAKSVSSRSVKFTTGDFESMVRRNSVYTSKSNGNMALFHRSTTFMYLQYSPPLLFITFCQMFGRRRTPSARQSLLENNFCT